MFTFTRQRRMLILTTALAVATWWTTGCGTDNMGAVLSGGSGGEPRGGIIPNAPSNVKASNADSNSITLNWSPVNGAAEYFVYRSTNPHGGYSFQGRTPRTSYTDGGLTPGTAYYYRVSAYNSEGESSRSSVYAYAVTKGGATPPGGGVTPPEIDDDLVGDWLFVNECVYGESDGNAPNHCVGYEGRISILTFAPSGQAAQSEMLNYGSFLIWQTEDSWSWRVSGKKMYWHRGNRPLDVDILEYGVSGNTLVIKLLYTDEKHSADTTLYTLDRYSIADLQSSATVYGADPALRGAWLLAAGGEDKLFFNGDGSFKDDKGKYFDRAGYYAWYAENARLFLLGLGCDEHGIDMRCVSYFIVETVELDYELTGGTLRLRPAGAGYWDVWGRSPDNRTAKRRSVSPSRTIFDIAGKAR